MLKLASETGQSGSPPQLDVSIVTARQLAARLPFVQATSLSFTYWPIWLIYVGEEEASFWYSSLYEATGELSVRKNANPATDFCISLNYT